MESQSASGPPPAAANVTRRPEQPGDEPFLFEVYASTRPEELAQTGWDAATRAAFLEMQFKAMRQGYRAMFPQGEFSLVLVDDVPIGRLVVNRIGSEIRLVDLALLPAWRGRGLGTRLLTELLAEAARAGKPVRLHVLKASRAVRLYERLGFSRQGEEGFYQQMESCPAG